MSGLTQAIGSMVGGGSQQPQVPTAPDTQPQPAGATTPGAMTVPSNQGGGLFSNLGQGVSNFLQNPIISQALPIAAASVGGYLTSPRLGGSRGALGHGLLAGVQEIGTLRDTNLKNLQAQILQQQVTATQQWPGMVDQIAKTMPDGPDKDAFILLAKGATTPEARSAAIQNYQSIKFKGTSIQMLGQIDHRYATPQMQAALNQMPADQVNKLLGTEAGKQQNEFQSLVSGIRTAHLTWTDEQVNQEALRQRPEAMFAYQSKLQAQRSDAMMNRTMAMITASNQRTAEMIANRPSQIIIDPSGQAVYGPGKTQGYLAPQPNQIVQMPDGSFRYVPRPQAAYQQAPMPGQYMTPHTRLDTGTNTYMQFNPKTQKFDIDTRIHGHIPGQVTPAQVSRQMQSMWQFLKRQKDVAEVNSQAFNTPNPYADVQDNYNDFINSPKGKQAAAAIAGGADPGTLMGFDSGGGGGGAPDFGGEGGYTGYTPPTYGGESSIPESVVGVPAPAPGAAPPTGGPPSAPGAPPAPPAKRSETSTAPAPGAPPRKVATRPATPPVIRMGGKPLPFVRWDPDGIPVVRFPDGSLKRYKAYKPPAESAEAPAR